MVVKKSSCILAFLLCDYRHVTGRTNRRAKTLGVIVTNLERLCKNGNNESMRSLPKEQEDHAKWSFFYCNNATCMTSLPVSYFHVTLTLIGRRKK
jgi:hypothetical protein